MNSIYKKGDIHERGCRLFTFMQVYLQRILKRRYGLYRRRTSLFLKGMMKMTDLDQIKELQERRTQLQVKYQSLKAEAIKAMVAASDESRAIMLEFDSLSKEIQNINQEIYNLEYADEIKAEQERKARAEAEKLAAEREKNEKERQRLQTLKAEIEEQAEKLKGKKKTSIEHFNSAAEKVLDILKVQLTPSTMCVEPNDAFTKSVFKASKSAYKALLRGKFYNVKEKRKTKKKDPVFSKLEIQNVEGYDNDLPLNEFDRAVLGIIISEYLADNLYTTVNIIHRALIGRPGQGLKGFYPKKDQKKSIVDSVIKLMSTVVDFSGVNDSLKEMKYTDKDGNEITFRASNLLLADIIDAKINGQEMEGVIFFKQNSPLFQIADAKDQVIRYPHALLNVPNQNNTPLVISLKNYVMRRICEIKLHKNLTPTITFNDVFSKCRLGKVSHDQQYNARNVIIKFLEHLKGQKFITDFEVKKRGNTIYGVTFVF